MAGYARAHVMRNSNVIIDDVEYNAQVTKVRFVPETPIQQMPVLVPTGTITDIGTTTWQVELGGVQDNGTGSLGAALRAAAGTQIEIVFRPKTGSGQDQITANVVAMPIEFGGEQGEFRTFDITLPVDGEPTFAQST